MLILSVSQYLSWADSMPIAMGTMRPSNKYDFFFPFSWRRAMHYHAQAHTSCQSSTKRGDRVHNTRTLVALSHSWACTINPGARHRLNHWTTCRHYSIPDQREMMLNNKTTVWFEKFWSVKLKQGKAFELFLESFKAALFRLLNLNQKDIDTFDSFSFFAAWFGLGSVRFRAKTLSHCSRIALQCHYNLFWFSPNCECYVRTCTNELRWGGRPGSDSNRLNTKQVQASLKRQSLRWSA